MADQEAPSSSDRGTRPDRESLERDLDTHDCISPSPDVFSYFSFTAPTERMKHGHFTVDAFTSYLLVFVTLGIQAVLLYCVYDKVIGHTATWQHGIVNTGQDWNLLEAPLPGCNSGDSLCSLENGTYTCSPPSVQLLGRWSELDTNNDGIWTMEEVNAEKDTLKCKYAVDAIEVFGVLLDLIKDRLMSSESGGLWIHPDVQSGNAIPKAYFTYIMGDVIMCGYRNEDMCGNLVKKGVFDAPLKNHNVPRIGKTVMSALDYCRKLLEPRGVCERFLPSTYATWKIESAQECGTPRYSKYSYKAPHEGSSKSMLVVDYKQRQRYESAQTPVFLTYKFCIILIWMLLIVSQVRVVFKTMAFVIMVKMETHSKHEHEALTKVHTPRESDEAVHSMSSRHAWIMGLVTLIRMIMHFVLLYVGLQFLGKNTDYVALLLDGVALLFIVEVESILYERGLRTSVRSRWEHRDPIPIETRKMKQMVTRPDITDLAWFLFVAACSVAFLLYYTKQTVVPVSDALGCTCVAEGSKCREAHAFSGTFWNDYWSKDVPLSIQSIKDMKIDYRVPQKVNLLKHHHSHTHLGLDSN